MNYYTLFATPIGTCAIVWTVRGIVGTQLPDRDTRTRVLKRFPSALESTPPADVQRVIDDIVALLRGEAIDFSAVALDLERVPGFNREVYDVTRAIARGTTLTYGDIASRIGHPEMARDVGQALGRNPFPLIIPCHRVLAARGKVGGFSAPGGTDTKLRLLAIEGVYPNGQLGLFSE
jgi:methylated-DNA-[protein]-cysteine S-methyltransferase